MEITGRLFVVSENIRRNKIKTVAINVACSAHLENVLFLPHPSY